MRALGFRIFLINGKWCTSQRSTQYSQLCSLQCICCTMCVLLFFTLDAELLARSQYSEGPATGHLDTAFSWFPCVYKQMLRWLPRFQVATTCFSCSPPDLHLLVTNFVFRIHVKYPLPPGDNPIAINNNNNNNKCTTTLQHMQGSRGKIGQKTLV